MTIVQAEDNRNLEWRSSNIGSKMLEKMGWTEGKGIGKRNVNTTALRAVKRLEGLGIGAKRQTEGGPSESTGTFAAVLANLKAHHAGDDNNSKKKKKNEKKLAKKKAQKTKQSLSLPQNKVLAGHARKMREAKFGAKSADDLACIFGNTEVVATATSGFGGIPAIGETKKRSRTSKKSKDDGNAESPPSSSSDDAETEPKQAQSDDTDSNSETEKERKRAAKKRKKEAESLSSSSSSTTEKKAKKEKKSKKSKKKSKES
jgi:Pin2-interacting protein X1